MTYFLLPKNNNVNIHIQFVAQSIEPFLNKQILHYYKEADNEINQIIYTYNLSEKVDCQKLLQTINLYDSIYPNINLNQPISSVCESQNKSILFYQFIEINYLFDLFTLCETNHLSILSVTPNFKNVNYYLEMMTDIDINDSIHSISSFNMDSYQVIKNQKYDFIFLEEVFAEENESKINLNHLGIHENNCSKQMIQMLYLVLHHLSNGGSCLMKITEMFEQSLIELMYVCSSLFEKVYLVKPSTSNSSTLEKYIFCKHLIVHRINKINENEVALIQQIFMETISNESREQNGKPCLNSGSNTLPKVLSMVKDGIPCYFLNKIYDFNSIMIQNQLEAIEQIIHLLKMKNKEDKYDILKKNNIHKSIMWCEKYKIPCNKVMEKTNMFLHDVHTIETK